MFGKPFFAGAILAAMVLLPLMLLIKTRGGGGPDETPPVVTLPREATPPQEEVEAVRAPSQRVAVERMEIEPVTDIDTKRLAVDLRDAVLSGGDVAAVLKESEGREAEVMRAYLTLLRDEGDLRRFAKLTQSLSSLPDPDGIVLRYCQAEVVVEERPIVKLILSEVLEARPDKGSIGPLRDLLNQYWYSENPDEAFGLLRTSLRGLGRIDSEAARDEIWKRFHGAPTDKLKSEALGALAMRLDDDVVSDLQEVMGNGLLSEEVRLGAARALARGMRETPGELGVDLGKVYASVGDHGVRAEFIRSAAETGKRRGLGFVEARLLDPGEDQEVRMAAVLALHHYGDDHSLEALATLTEGKGNGLLASHARAAVEAIRRRSGE